MAETSCPECGATWPRPRTSCSVCEWKASPGSKGPRDLGCTWTGPGWRCPMPGSVGSAGQALCDWHYTVRRDIKHLDVFHAFSAWVDSQARYCGWAQHYPIQVLWDWVHGQTASFQHSAPVPCLLVDCIVRLRHTR